MEFVLEHRAHASAHYAMLARIPMPCDAANLHVPGRDPVDDALCAAWAAAKMRERLRAQIEPLWYATTDAYLQVPEAAPSSSRERPVSLTLLGGAREGARALIEAHDMQHAPGPGPLPRSTHRWLTQTRAALYERASEAPLLRIIDVPVLGYMLDGVRFTRGRATRNERGEHIVAVSLDADPEQVAIQILHEETHPITDPAIYAKHKGVQRRTDGSGAGGALHLELEQLVVDVDAAIIATRAPELMEAYEVWRGQFGM